MITHGEIDYNALKQDKEIAVDDEDKNVDAH